MNANENTRSPFLPDWDNERLRSPGILRHVLELDPPDIICPCYGSSLFFEHTSNIEITANGLQLAGKYILIDIIEYLGKEKVHALFSLADSNKETDIRALNAELLFIDKEHLDGTTFDYNTRYTDITPKEISEIRSNPAGVNAKRKVDAIVFLITSAVKALIFYDKKKFVNAFKCFISEYKLPRDIAEKHYTFTSLYFIMLSYFNYDQVKTEQYISRAVNAIATDEFNVKTRDEAILEFNNSYEKINIDKFNDEALNNEIVSLLDKYIDFHFIGLSLFPKLREISLTAADSLSDSALQAIVSIVDAKLLETQHTSRLKTLKELWEDKRRYDIGIYKYQARNYMVRAS